jgi:putative ABC transport system permease protein
MMRHDLRTALRSLLRNPGFTGIAIATLALGIGANAAIFTLVDRVLLRLLPVPRSEELVLLRSPGPRQGHTWSDGDDDASFSYPMYEHLRDRNRAFSGILAVFPLDASVTGREGTEPARAELVSGNYFATLGVPAQMGRAIDSSDTRAPGASPVAVLSDDFFVRRFGANPSVVGRTIEVNGHPLEIVGVSRRGFRGVQPGRPADLFIPVTMKAAMMPTSRALEDPKDHWLQLIGRLRAGMDRTRAEASLAVTYGPLLRQLLPQMNNWSDATRSRFLARRIELRSGEHGRLVMQSSLRTPLLAVSGLVALVLLIACVNLAGLSLTRGVVRQREFGVRAAIGASRAALLRQSLVESLLLAVAGGAIGLGIAEVLLRLLIRAVPADSELNLVGLALDFRVAAFAAAASVLSGLLFGSLPAWRASRLDPARSLQGGRSEPPGAQRLRRGLVSAQVAFTIALVVAAGLFTRSLGRLARVSLGLRPDGVLGFTVAPGRAGYDPARSAPLARRLTESLAALPGVRSVGAATIGSFRGDESGTNLRRADRDLPPEAPDRVRRNWVGPGYFDTLGIRLEGGRAFRWSDDASARKVAVLNETAARSFFPGENPVGKRIGFGGRDAPAETEIIGVVRDHKTASVDERPMAAVFLPYLQDPNLAELTIYVRSVGRAAALAPSVREAVRRFDPRLPVLEMRTLRGQIRDSTTTERLLGIRSAAFAALAALLASIGIYGALAFAVTRRRREIGVRIASGADDAAIRRLVLSDAARFLLIGGAVGVPAALLLGRGASSLLFGIAPWDPTAFAGGLLLVSATVLLAAWFPALRASRVNPVEALRAE